MIWFNKYSLYKTSDPAAKQKAKWFKQKTWKKVSWMSKKYFCWLFFRENKNGYVELGGIESDDEKDKHTEEEVEFGIGIKIEKIYEL